MARPAVLEQDPGAWLADAIAYRGRQRAEWTADELRAAMPPGRQNWPGGIHEAKAALPITPRRTTMTTTATASRLQVLDQATELDLVQQTFPGENAADMRVSTKLTLTGTDEEGRQGYVDLTIRTHEEEGQATFDMDASQVRQLAAYLLLVADELDARAA